MSTDPTISHATGTSGIASPHLEATSLERFNQEGYLLFPGFFPTDCAAEMTATLDRLRGELPFSKQVATHLPFSLLYRHPAVLGLVRALLGERFLFHHGNGQRIAANDTGKAWHHDYDGPSPWTAGVPMMIHLLGYPAGLTTEGGALALLPGSHRLAVERHVPRRHGTESLPGERVICGGPGLLLVINSALWHARRANLSGEPRYYFNFSYCQFGVARPERSEYAGELALLALQASTRPSELDRLLLTANPCSDVGEEGA